MVLAAQLCFSQNMVSGKVVDELGFPLYKAAISVAGSEEVVYTDFDGNFTYESPKAFHWKLTITSEGFEPEFFFVMDGGSMETIALRFDMDLEEILSEEVSLDTDSKSTDAKKGKVQRKNQS